MRDLNDAEIAQLQDGLDRLPTGFEPLHLSALDGFLCGVLLQPQPVSSGRWWPAVVGAVHPQTPPDAASARAIERIRGLVQRRHGALDRAIGSRRWFDPWLLDPGRAAEAAVRTAVLPWAAGFALAQQHFPQLEAIDSGEAVEALALLYQYLDADDLEEGQGVLVRAIAELAPAHTLAEAAEDLVRGVLLLADISRPGR